MALVKNLVYKADDFILNIPQWEFPDTGITCILGESGSGKTSLLQILCGLLIAKDMTFILGETHFENTNVKHRNFGIVFQDYALFPHLTVFQNIAFAAESRQLQNETWIPQAEKLIQRLSLKGIVNQKANTLSGGEQQRVALARALVTRPQMILLDEPFSALDEKIKQKARNLVWELSREFAVPFLLVTHDLRDVRQLAENVLLLSQGQSLGYGKTKDLLDHPQSLKAALAISENQILKLSTRDNGYWIDDYKIFCERVVAGTNQPTLSVKPWDFIISRDPQNSLRARIHHVYSDGQNLQIVAVLKDGQSLRLSIPRTELQKDMGSYSSGAELALDLQPRRGTIFTGASS